MEAADRALIKRYVKSDVFLKRLYEEHKILDRRIDKLSNRQFLTVAEEQEQKKLKKMKLRGVDRMLSRARSHNNHTGYDNAMQA